MSTFPPSEHFMNYLRYRQEWLKKQQPFTASQQDTPPQYLPYAQYPTTPKVRGVEVHPPSTTTENEASA